MPTDKAAGNEIPLRKRNGINKNMGKEGSTYQNVPSAWSAIRIRSLVSPYIQTIPKIEIKGRDAIKLPNKGSFLDISDIITIIPAEISNFAMYQTIVLQII